MIDGDRLDLEVAFEGGGGFAPFADGDDQKAGNDGGFGGAGRAKAVLAFAAEG